jgi:hypothetical protein
MRAIFLAGMFLGSSVAGFAQQYTWKEKTWEQLTDKELSDWGRQALKINSAKWKHGETEHFVIHHFRMGEMVARRCELFYSDIRQFFGNRADQIPGKKSHVFAFFEPADWKQFVAGTGLPAQARGVTRGNEFFYMPVDDGKQFDFKGRVQAHEMTHLVFNRFFTGMPPLWLNEGIAEYFGMRKTMTTIDFRKALGAAPAFDLDALLTAKRYPTGEQAMFAFYTEAAIVVDFLTESAQRQALLPKFVDSLIEGKSLEESLNTYGYKSIEEFYTAYKTYRRKFGVPKPGSPVYR